MCACVYSLSHVAFGGGVEGGHLHGAGELWSHLKQHFLKGVELAALCVHVVLVHLERDSRLVKPQYSIIRFFTMDEQLIVFHLY